MTRIRTAVLMAAVAATFASRAEAQRDSARPPAEPGKPDSSSLILLDRIAAIVGSRAITLTELYQAFYFEVQQRQEDKRPPLPTDTVVAKKIVIDMMIDSELLMQQASLFKLVVPEERLNAQYDAHIQRVRNELKTPAEFREFLKNQGAETPDEYRRIAFDQLRRRILPEMVIDTLKTLGRLPKVSVSEKDIKEAYDSVAWPNKGPTIRFRQIVIRPKPTVSSDTAAKALADSLQKALLAGASFDSVARAFSADSVSAVQGGDLGFFRRGRMVKQFEEMAFALPIDRISPVIKTEHGYHILKVDRVRAGEVRARHVLIKLKIDSADVARARALGDSVAAAIRSGASFDSLVALYHDAPVEQSQWSEPWVLAEIPEMYQKALAPLKPNDVAEPFELPSGGSAKIAVAQLVSRNDTGIPTLDEKRHVLRETLQQNISMRRLLDALRKETYVDVRLEDKPAPAKAVIKQ